MAQDTKPSETTTLNKPERDLTTGDFFQPQYPQGSDNEISQMNRRQMSSRAVNQTNEVDPASISYLSDILNVFYIQRGRGRYKPSLSMWDHLSVPTLQALQRIRRKKKKKKNLKVPPIPISAAAPIIHSSEIIIIRWHYLSIFGGKGVLLVSFFKLSQEKTNEWIIGVLKCWTILLCLRIPQNKSNSIKQTN